MSQVLIYGGSFNPPHIAHVLTVRYLLETMELAELWIVPAYVHAFGKPLAPFEHRVAMCEMLAHDDRVKVMRTEEDVARRADLVAGRTLDLLTYCREVWPGFELRLVIGADILGETHKWHRWDDVVALAPPVVIGRAGHALPPGAAETGITMPEVSSSRVRELLAQLTAEDRAALAGPMPAWGPDLARELRALLPMGILWYIARSGLYA